MQQYARKLEEHPSFLLQKADFYYCVILNVLFLLMLAYIWGDTPILSQPLVFAFLYIWSRREPRTPVFIFSFKFEAYQLPFVKIVLWILLGNSIVPLVMGLLSGHIYHFLKDVLPVTYNKNPLKTPSFFSKIVQNISPMNFNQQYQQGGQQRPEQGWRPFQGTGHRL